MNIAFALIAVTFVSLLSLLGVVFLVLKRKSFERIMSTLLALSSGVLLGGAFFDLLPESLNQLPNLAFIIVIGGIISFFSLEKMLSWHHHIEGDHPGETKAAGYLSLVGDGIHNFIDGVVIGSSFLVSTHLGIAVTLGVIAHEIPHELADFTILIHSGFSNKKALLFNFLSATTAIAGTLIIVSISSIERSVIPFLLPFGAGNFLYIAMSDLIPELHKVDSKKDSAIQLLALIAGACLIYLLPKG